MVVPGCDCRGQAKDWLYIKYFPKRLIPPERIGHYMKHEGSPVQSGNRPKYVIRSDVLFTEVWAGLTLDETDDPLWKNDEIVRETFQNKSPALNPTFLSHVKSLYNPHKGVENAGPLLYSLVRFTKSRKIVEIGAGYTTLWLLQALKDNGDEILGASHLQEERNCKLLDIPWTVPDVIDKYNTEKSSLLCIDNCLHQRETATGAGAIARVVLGLEDYLEFVKGDAFAMDFDEEIIDLLWCDFGVGARAKEFVANAWKSVRPGGFLICHSTLTNQRTRSWLEEVRNREGESSTGMPCGEYVELSLLEPHKRFQNSITIVLQRRRGHNTLFEEPIRSEYA
jgi:predicted O-methyltransferase YrrM